MRRSSIDFVMLPSSCFETPFLLGSLSLILLHPSHFHLKTWLTSHYNFSLGTCPWPAASAQWAWTLASFTYQGSLSPLRPPCRLGFLRLASVVRIQRSNRKICLSPLALASTRTQRFNEPGIQPRSKSLAAFSHCRCDTLEFSALTCSKSCFTRRANWLRLSRNLTPDGPEKFVCFVYSFRFWVLPGRNWSQ